MMKIRSRAAKIESVICRIGIGLFRFLNLSHNYLKISQITPSCYLQACRAQSDAAADADLHFQVVCQQCADQAAGWCSGAGAVGGRFDGG